MMQTQSRGMGKYLSEIKPHSCRADCMLVESGFECDMTPDTQSTCKEICGDGINMGFNECDDGNTDSFDGCGTYCTIDPGY